MNALGYGAISFVLGRLIKAVFVAREISWFKVPKLSAVSSREVSLVMISSGVASELFDSSRSRSNSDGGCDGFSLLNIWQALNRDVTKSFVLFDAKVAALSKSVPIALSLVFGILICFSLLTR